MSAPLVFFQRPYPSANAILLTGPRPVLVDPGFGADAPAMRALLQAQGADLAGIVNTHFDCDHVGANHAFPGVPIAAHALEAAMVNARHPEACRARWLHQPVEPYRVARTLHDGDVVDTGSVQWRVLHTPGHTAGHISLHAPEHGVLVTGDAVHADDLGWVDWRQEGATAQAEATIDRLAALPLQCAYSGHGGPTCDPALAFEQARRRLQGWREAPERMAWHGVKRVLAYALMIEDGITEAALLPHLLACPWLHDYAADPFGLTPEAFGEALVAEMLRARAARWRDGRLVATAPFVAPPPGWATAPTIPADWPA